MDYRVFIYLVPFFMLAMIFLLVQCRRRWEVSSARFLFYCALSSLGFLVFNTLELVLLDPGLKILAARIEHIWAGGIVASWFLFTLDFTGRNEWTKPGRFWPVLLPSLADVFLVFTNDYHRLIWQDIHFFVRSGLVVFQVEHGPAYFVLLAMQYSFPIFGIALLVKEFPKSQDLYRRQLRWVISGAVLALGCNVVYVSKLLPWLRKDYTPLGYALAVLAISVGILRHGFLTLVPIPRSRLFDSLVDGILVLDRKHRIIDLNKTAERVLGLSRRDLGASSYRCKLLVPLFEKADSLSNSPVTEDVSVELEGRKLYYEIRLSREFGTSGALIGTVIVLHDVTERVRLFEEVKTLRGIVPICGKCKRVRNDEGYWQQVEAYVTDHSYAEFSHGLCPVCLEEFYPSSPEGKDAEKPS